MSIIDTPPLSDQDNLLYSDESDINETNQNNFQIKSKGLSIRNSKKRKKSIIKRKSKIPRVSISQSNYAHLNT